MQLVILGLGFYVKLIGIAMEDRRHIRTQLEIKKSDKNCHLPLASHRQAQNDETFFTPISHHNLFSNCSTNESFNAVQPLAFLSEFEQ